MMTSAAHPTATTNRGWATPYGVNRLGGVGFRAIQSDTAATCEDWLPFHRWNRNDPAFTELVSVRSDGGDPVTLVDWFPRTDGIADQSLARLGWTRTGPWGRDWRGRRVAPVLRNAQWADRPGASDLGRHDLAVIGATRGAPPGAGPPITTMSVDERSIWTPGTA